MAHSDEIKVTAIVLFEAARTHTSEAAASARVAQVIAETHKTKITGRTVRRWAKERRNIRPELDKTVQDKKKQLADLFEETALRLLGGVTDDKLKTAYPDRLVKAARDAAETMQLLRGGATSRNVETQRAGSLWDHINSVSKNGNAN